MVFGPNADTLEGLTVSPFNSLWELDGVRTKIGMECWLKDIYFQFPVGIRWCSDKTASVRNSERSELSIPCGN